MQQHLLMNMSLACKPANRVKIICGIVCWFPLTAASALFCKCPSLGRQICASLPSWRWSLSCLLWCTLQLDMVLRLGVPTERIVFANACKRPRDIRCAAAKQVRLRHRSRYLPFFWPPFWLWTCFTSVDAFSCNHCTSG